MEKLKVTLEIHLRATSIQEALEEEKLTEEEILKEIENHILDAIGHKWHEGWHYIEDCTIISIGVS